MKKSGMRTRNIFSRIMAAVLAAVTVLGSAPSYVRADEYNVTYGANAELMQDLPGVYQVSAKKADKKADNKTLGIPSIAKQNLESMPTTESPAIIQGAAVPFEKRVNTSTTIRFDRISSDPICAPYSEFRYTLVEENDANGTGTHTKITGYDGTYVIIRVDVSDLIDVDGDKERKFLHYKITGNKAMLVNIGQDLVKDEGGKLSVTFADGLGGKVGCYSLREDAKSLRDKDGNHTDKPYVDFIVMSSGSHVAGADKGKENEANADFPISFYVDEEDDYNEELEWDATQNLVINAVTHEAVADIVNPDGTVITPETQMLAKYYDEEKAKQDQGITDNDITGYTVKGDDLELEVMIDEINEDLSTQKEYWSMRRAMDCQDYDRHEITLMCEVPVLEGLVIEDTDGSGREVALNVNSFDIQIANNTASNAAGLTIRNNASLTIMDDSNTTGAEMAVGNNATMLIRDGGRLIIDETCQFEVEYDSASTPVAPEGQQQEEQPDYSMGVLRIEDGGEVVNNGIITVEGCEGKAQDPADAASIIRDYKDAILTVGQGGKITNNGCMLVNGQLFNLGTIVNNGRYNDVIESDDPDKGSFTYHRGIQMSWKDDITQGYTNVGSLDNGMTEDGTTCSDARIENNGDIVLVPGLLRNHSLLENNGDIYLAAVNEVMIPITSTQDAPTVTEERVDLGYYETSSIINTGSGKIDNKGNIRTADIEIVSNGRTGKISREVSSDLSEINIENFGTLGNSGNACIAVNMIDNAGHITNSDNASFTGSYQVDGERTDVITKLVLEENSDGADALFEDFAKNKNADVYNGARKTTGNTDTWRFAPVSAFEIMPANEPVAAGNTVDWMVMARTEADGDDVKYLAKVIQNGTGESVDLFAIPVDETVIRTSPQAPTERVNIVYIFGLVGTLGTEREVTLRVNGEVSELGIVRPTAMQNLVYDGTEQVLVTHGSTTDGEMQYSLDGGPFSAVRPTAKNAGTYEVAYRIIFGGGSSTVVDPGGTVTVQIAPRPLYIDVDDQCSKKGDAQTPLSYTAYGLVESDKDSLGITLETNADLSTSGRYSIMMTWNGEGNTNYEMTEPDGTSRISTEGVYCVTNHDLNLTPNPVVDPDGTQHPQVPGVKSNFASYQNMNESITLSAKYKNWTDPSKETLANVYYSDTTPLDPENYKTAGTTMAPNYAAVGTFKTVYYCIEVPGENQNDPPADLMWGSKIVAITKGEQKAPGIKQDDQDKENVLVITPPEHSGLAGYIGGLEPRKMEYRRADSDTYKRVAFESVSLTAGYYYVRRMGDARYAPGPDTEVEIHDPGTPCQVTFKADPGHFPGGTETEITRDVFYGIPIKESDVDVPERDDSVGFRAWTLNGEEYDFSKPVMGDMDLLADWDIEKYTVIFDSKGGTFVDSQMVEKGDKAALPQAPSRNGQTFDGWRLDGQPYDFDSPVNEDITLTAAWDPGTYNVKFNANTGNGTMADQTFTFGRSQDLAENKFGKPGCIFAAWNTKADGTGTAYEDCQSVRDIADTTKDPIEDVMLYAQWKKKLDYKYDSDHPTVHPTGIEVTIAGGQRDYNGRAHRPNVTVTDKEGNKDITRYCSFVYSDNINAGTAKVLIRVNSSNAMYVGTREETFTIGQAEAPAARVIQKQYVYSEEAYDSIDLSPYLLSDRGVTTWTVTNGGADIFESDSVVVNDVLSYSLKTVASELEGTITAVAHTQNYGDATITVEIGRIGLGLYEKVGKTYVNVIEKVMNIGEKATLVPQYADGTIVNKRVVWYSTDPAVASVTQDGKVTATASGVTDIRAMSEDRDTLLASCRLIVNEPVSSVTLGRTSHAMGTGERLVLSASVIPYNADRKLKWTTSSDCVKLVVSADTLSATVIGNKAGSAKVTAAATDGSKKSAVCNVTIGNPVSKFTIGAKGNVTNLAVGKTLSLSVDWKGTKPKNTNVSWKIQTPYGGDASAIATVSPKGVLTGISEGAVRITAVSESNPDKTASTEINVYVPVKSVALNATSGTISRSEDSHGLKLIAYVTSAISGQSATGERLGTAPVARFEVDGKYTDRLMVDASGLVKLKPKAPAGTIKNIPVYVTVSAFGGYSKKLTCKVSVTDKNALTGITISRSSMTLGTNNTETLSASLKPLNADGEQGIEWESSDNDVATVDANGVVTGKAAGTAVITARAKGTVTKAGKTTHPSVTCKVTVKPSVSSIEVTNGAELSRNGLASGKSCTIKTKLTPSGAAPTSIVWKSSDPGVATVDQKGVVKAIGPKNGAKTRSLVTITATLTDKKSTGRDVGDAIIIPVYEPVKKIVIDKTKMTIGTYPGSMYGTVSVVQFVPENAFYRDIEWAGDNDNVVIAAIDKDTEVNDPEVTYGPTATTTDKNNVLAVKALKPGTTKLTGVARDGIKVTCTVTVCGSVSGLSLTERAGNFNNITPTATAGVYESRMKTGSSMSITPVVDINGISGATAEPAEKKLYNAYKKYTDTSVSYRSSNTAIATVSNGKVSIKKGATGNVTIHVMTADGNNTVSLNITVVGN